MQLLIDRVEDDGRHRVVSHQRRQLEDPAPTEELDRPGEPLRAEPPLAEELWTEADDQSLFLPGAGAGLAALHEGDDLRVETFLERGRLVRRPLELVVELPRRHENRQLGQAPVQRGVEPEILVGRPHEPGELRGIEPDAARSSQPDQRPALRAHDLVVERLPWRVEIGAREERKTGQGVGVDVLRQPRYLFHHFQLSSWEVLGIRSTIAFTSRLPWRSTFIT